MKAEKRGQEWIVIDDDEGFIIWWPHEVAAKEIERAEDQEAHAEYLCQYHPSMGTWHN